MRLDLTTNIRLSSVVIVMLVGAEVGGFFMGNESGGGFLLIAGIIAIFR